VDLAFWIVWALVGLLFELATLAKPQDKLRPLTYWIRRYVPHALIVAAIGWLALHFGVE
jgi:hypothetical protein